MSQARWEQLSHIFEQARELLPEERADFIARACAADQALRAEAQSLVDADAAARDFMTEPALERLAQRIATDGWSVRSGDAIGPYTIQVMLGAGGAGEVWRARDERLGRDVAIKLLLPHVATDADRLRRFADEARTAGALNHSNILTVHDVGEHRGIPYLVSECLDGQNLRQRMDAGALSVDDAVAIALNIARGLAAAHVRAIVHRDLKPENTFITSDGVVKILDFGLAKLQSSLDGTTQATPETITGVIVGTAGYMAPEQVKGDNVDARVDLFALGVMLYEMLAHQHPFRSGSTFETLHAVLTTVPPDISSLNPHVPPALGRIVMRLIEKTPAARVQTAPDLIWALEQVAARSTAAPSTAPRVLRSLDRFRSRSLWAGAATVVGALAVIIGWSRFESGPIAPAARSSELTQFTWPLPPGTSLGSAPAVAPDGTKVAFVGLDAAGSRLYVRDRRSAAAAAVGGTAGAMHPFWSADSKSLGFFAGGRLQKVSWPGGVPVPLAPALFPFGGSWNNSGTIVFAPDVIMTGLWRVAVTGGDTAPATLLDSSLGDTSHSWPVFLPDGAHFLYFVRSARDERRGVYVGRVDERPAAGALPLLRSDSNATYVSLSGTAEGMLLYVVNGRVEARRFDPRTLMLAGDPLTVDGLSAAGSALTQPAMVTASADVLVVATGTVPYGSRLEAVNRAGERLHLWEPPEAQNWPSISPNGRYLARQRVDALRNTPDIWVADLTRGTDIRVTTALEPDLRPIWSADSRYLAYVTGNIPNRPGARMLHIAAADGTGVVRSLPCPGEYCEPTDWSAVGLLVNVIDAGRRDVWIVPTDGTAAAQPLLAGAFDERDARLSPDGRWVAYVSEESDRPEVSIRTIAGAPERIPVSASGGDHPVWRRNGRELFFVDPNGQLQSVAVGLSRGRPTLGLPAKMNVPPIGRGHWGTPYDVSPDGERIYFLRRNEDPAPTEMHVVIGWRALLR